MTSCSSAAVTTTPRDQQYRIWSLARQKFLELKISADDEPKITCTGTGDERTSILEKKDAGDSNKNAYVFVFEHGTEKYSLYKDDDNIAAKQISPNHPVEKAASFVPEDFGISCTGPFKALKVESGQCLAANISDGTLSLKAFHETEPHPDTIFIMSKIF